MCMAWIVLSVLPEQLLVPGYGRKKKLYIGKSFRTRGIMAATIAFSRLEVSSADPLFTLLKEAHTYI